MWIVKFISREPEHISLQNNTKIQEKTCTGSLYTKLQNRHVFLLLESCFF